jgi:hypothetical protein
MTDNKFQGTYYEDRHGRQLEVGQIVRVQHCVGRYGQTDIVEGRIKAISPYGVVTLDQAWGRGSTQIVAGVVTVTVSRTGYDKLDDFEHGHEKWTEIIKGDHP